MRKILFIAIISAPWVCLFQQACHQPVAAKPVVRHLAEIHKNGSVLYIDKVDSRYVLKPDNKDAFTSYKIGFEDSVQGNSTHEQQKNVYFDYRMSNDWKAVVDGDSVAPVFFQPVQGLSSKVKEGIIVFELPAGKQPDALVYDDSFGAWQKQVIALNQNIK